MFMAKLRSIENYVSVFKWNIIFYIKYWTSTEFRKAIYKNLEIHNSHAGERCYVVGNGPSLKMMELSKLKNEFVFTVNTIYRNDAIFNTINSNCHIIVDPTYASFNDNEAKSFVDSITKYNPQIQLITNFYSNNIYSKYHSIIYQIFPHRNWTEKPVLDFTSNMLIAQNVVQVAIYAAIYMGFKEIVLIGCDMTSFYENFAANAGRCESFHAYELTEKDMAKYNEVKEKHDNAYMLQDYAITFDIFKKIQKYAQSHNIIIINATLGGILDMFPRKDFNEL